MAKFHLNPTKGPLPCSAADGQCPYGSDAPHFASKQEAQQAYEKLLERETGAFVAHRRTRGEAPSHFTPALQKLDEALEGLSPDELLRFAGKSSRQHEAVSALIDARATEGPLYYARLQRLNPQNPEAATPVTAKTFKALKATWDSYRNHTAILVEAHTQSPFYSPLSDEYPSQTPVGTALPITAYSHNDTRWYLSRFETVGGSDVGALAVHDFRPEEEQSSFDRLSFKKVVESKVTQVTEEYAEGMIRFSELSRKGPIYRGTVWEDRIRDKFAEDHGDLQVWRSKQQYVRGDEKWHRVNFDGIVGPRGSKKPEGILEIKTGGVPELWSGGVPLSYRAQTLYYLHATNLDRAYVRVLLNDGDSRDYEISSQDEVAPGSGVTMEQYVETRVRPWFEELKRERKNSA